MHIPAQAPVDALDGLLPAAVPVRIHEAAGYHLNHLQHTHRHGLSCKHFTCVQVCQQRPQDDCCLDEASTQFQVHLCDNRDRRLGAFQVRRCMLLGGQNDISLAGMPD